MTVTARSPHRYRPVVAASLTASCFAAALLGACVSPFDNCETRRTCPADGGAGGDTGDSGFGGDAQEGGSPAGPHPSGGQGGRVLGTGGALSGTASADGGDGGLGGQGPIDTGGAGGTTGDSCSDDYCQNDGECVEDGATIRCDCAPGFEGDQCETNIDDCPRDACQNGGTCVDGIESYSRECTAGFTGASCEIPRFEWIGPLDSYVRVTGLSGDGRVVVGSFQADASAQLQPFRWTSKEGLRLLGGIESGTATAVNYDGTVIVGVIDGSNREAFRWTLATGPVRLGGKDSGATAVSHDGNTIVGFTTSSSGQTEVFHWTSDTQLRELGTMIAGASAKPTGVSGDGSIIVGGVYESNTNKTEAGFRWARNTFFRIGSEDTAVWAYAISGDGTVIVGAYVDAGRKLRSFQWTATKGFQDIPLGDLEESSALVVNSDGSVIGGRAYTTHVHGWLWRAHRGVELLADLIADAGVDLTDWSQIVPTGISADGSVVVGVIYYPDAGGPRSWLLRLAD